MRAASVLMLVNIEVASAVKRRELFGRDSSDSMALSSKKSLKKEVCFRARG